MRRKKFENVNNEIGKPVFFCRRLEKSSLSPKEFEKDWMLPYCRRDAAPHDFFFSLFFVRSTPETVTSNNKPSDKTERKEEKNVKEKKRSR